MLTTAQLTVLKADILANSGPGGEFENIPNTPDGNFAIADAYNLEASPGFYVWRTSISQMEINEAIDWSEVTGLTTNEMIAFQLLKDQDTFDASKASIRQAFNAIFVSNQQPNSNGALVALSKRLARRIEKLLSTGVGTVGSPATMGFEGQINYVDVTSARNLT